MMIRRAATVRPAGQPDRLDQNLIVPLVFKPEQLNHDFHWLLVMGRLKAGETMAQAQANMDAVTTQIAKDNPKDTLSPCDRSGFHQAHCEGRENPRQSQKVFETNIGGYRFPDARRK